MSYVALGDSYTAGPLIAPPAENAPASCFRSAANYPGYVASYLGAKPFSDVSCSGAVTAVLYSSPANESALPAQLDAVKPSTDLVTLGIGGNDFNLFATMFSAAFAGGDESASLASAAAVEPRIEAAIDAIGSRAPKARIVVVGYLRVLPKSGTCAGLSAPTAALRSIDAVERRLNTSVATAAKNKGVTFIDAYALSTGHDVCAGTNAWVNGSTTDISRAAPFHPFRAGMDAVARAIYATVSGKPIPKTPSLGSLERVRR